MPRVRESGRFVELRDGWVGALERANVFGDVRVVAPHHRAGERLDGTVMGDVLDAGLGPGGASARSASSLGDAREQHQVLSGIE